MTNDITLAELDADLLPERQTMWGVNIFAPTVVVASNTAYAVQALTAFSSNTAAAVQVINA
jgi:hypothetical protein